MSFLEEGASFEDPRISSPNNLTPISLNFKLLSTEDGEKSPESPFVAFNYKIIKTLALTHFKTPADDKAMYKQLFHFNFFPIIQDHHALSIEDVIKLCHCVKYESVKAGTIIFQKGDPSNKKAYLIISGSVSHTGRDLGFLRQRIIKQITTESNDEDDKTDIIEPKFYSPRAKSRFGSNKSPDIRKKNPIQFADEPGDTFESVATSQKKAEDSVEHHHENKKDKYNFRKYNVGQFFGESALLGNEERNETMIAITDSEFIIVDEECILKAKDLLSETDEDLDNIFWANVPGIAIKPRDRRYYKYYDVLTLDKGASLTSQAESGEYVYLIKEGECQGYIKKSVKHAVGPHTTREFESKALEKCFRIKTTTENSMKLFISPPGSFVGEEILFNTDGVYNYSVKVLSVNATVFRIEKHKLLNKYPRDVLHSLKQLYEKKLSTNGKFVSQKNKLLLDDSGSLLIKFPNENSGFLSARSDGSPKPMLISFRQPKSTDNSPSENSSSPTFSGKSSDEESHKVKKRVDMVQKKSEFMKYAKKPDDTKNTLTMINSKVLDEPKESKEQKEINTYRLSETGKLSPKLEKKDINNINQFKLKFESPPETKSPPKKAIQSPRAQLAKLAVDKIPVDKTKTLEFSPKTLNEIMDQEYKHYSPRTTTSIANLATSIVLHERPIKKASMTPRTQTNLDYYHTLQSITSLGKIPEPKTTTNVDLPSSTNIETFTTALKSNRSINTIRQKLELKPRVIKTLVRIQTKT